MKKVLLNLTILLTVYTVSATANECLLYGVQDEALNDTQFFSLNPENSQINLLGNLQPGEDIEALTIHPETNTLYATAGDDGRYPGRLYQVDKNEGTLTVVGDTGFSDINSIAFDPDGLLWGWVENQGLFTFDHENATSHLVTASSRQIEDIIWTRDGKYILAAENETLFIYKKNGDLDKTCTLPGETEGLEMLTDDWVILGMNNQQDFSIQIMDIQHCTVIPASAMITQFNDIEGFALPVNACLGEQTLKIGGIITCGLYKLDFNQAEVSFNQNNGQFTGEFGGNASYSFFTQVPVYISLSGRYHQTHISANAAVYSDALHSQLWLERDFSGDFDNNGFLNTTTNGCTVNLFLE